VLLTALLGASAGAGWDNLRDRPLPAGYRWLVFGMAGFTYVVGFLGAYLRQRGVELACNQWPVCRDGFAPAWRGGWRGGIRVSRTGWRRCCWRWAPLDSSCGGGACGNSRPDLYRGSQWVLALVLAQALVGARWSSGAAFAEVSQLLHAGLVALVFGALCYLCLQSLPRPARARTRHRRGDAPPGSAPLTGATITS